MPAPRGGFIEHVNAETIGRVALELGAGRVKVSDTPNLAAGLDALLQQGDVVTPGQPFCFLCADTERRAESLVEQTLAAFTITDSQPPERELVAETLIG